MTDEEKLRLEAITAAIDTLYKQLALLGEAKLRAIHSTPQEEERACTELCDQYSDDFDAYTMVDWDVQVADEILAIREFEEEEKKANDEINSAIDKG